MADKKDLSILVLYQGIEASRWKNALIAYLSSLGFQPMAVSWADDVFENLVIAEVYKQIRECDAAIAILTPDTRPSSTAGNLWFEIGLWNGLRSPDALLVCVQDPPKEDTSEWQVKVPSDLNNNVAPRFLDDTGLQLCALTFVNRIWERKKSNTVAQKGRPPLDRIRDTLLRDRVKPTEFDAEELFSCPIENGRACSFREKSCILLSELLRMGRANHEQAIIESCIKEIFSLAASIMAAIDELAKTGQGEPNTTNAAVRRAKSEDLWTAIRRLRETADKLLKRNDTYPEDPANPKDPWTQLRFFLHRRIDWASKWPPHSELRPILGPIDGLDHPWLAGAPDVILRAKEEAQAFINWSTRMEKERTDFSKLSFSAGQRTNTHAENIQELVNAKTFCEDMSSLLTILKECYFYHCRHSIQTGLTKMHDPSSIDMTFDEICKGLPHNAVAPLWPPIWPTT